MVLLPGSSNTGSAARALNVIVTHLPLHTGTGQPSLPGNLAKHGRYAPEGPFHTAKEKKPS